MKAKEVNRKYEVWVIRLISALEEYIFYLGYLKVTGAVSRLRRRFYVASTGEALSRAAAMLSFDAEKI